MVGPVGDGEANRVLLGGRVSGFASLDLSIAASTSPAMFDMASRGLEISSPSMRSSGPSERAREGGSEGPAVPGPSASMAGSRDV